MLASRLGITRPLRLHKGLALLVVGLVCLLPLFTLAIDASAEANEADNASVFVPTKDWQAIGPGVSVPPGLHIRVDLTTGERFAKLLGDDESGVNSTAATVTIPPKESPEETQAVDAARITKEKVLMKLPPGELEAMGMDFDKAKAELSKDEYWELIDSVWDTRQALIQKVYDQMLKPAEELAKLIATISKPHNSTMDEMRVALEQLEDYLTDIDMTRDFHTLGGWPHLVRLLDPDHPSEVRWRAAWALGNAVKNDAEFQLWFLEAETVAESAIARLLGALREPAGANADRHRDELLRKGVYALTSAARGNSEVLAAVMEAGGLETLGALLSADHASTSLKVKVATFGVDVLEEMGHAAAEAAGVSGISGVTPDVTAVRSAVTSRAWCEGAVALLEHVQMDPVSTEKVLLSLHATHAHCRASGYLDVDRLRRSLDATRALYTGAAGAKVECEEAYRAEVVESVDQLFSEVGNAKSREEL